MKRVCLLVFGFSLAASAVVAQKAAVGPMEPAERFKAADTNRDTKVDKAEFLATLIPDAKPFIDAIWANRDTNKDGWLTQDEMTTNGPPPRVGPGGAALPTPPARP